MKAKTRVQEIAVEMVAIGPQIKRKFFADIFQSMDIPHSQIMTLLILSEHQGCCNFSALSKCLNVSAPTVTGIIDRLEKSKFVERIYDQKDRRSINVQLTDSGCKVIREIKEAVIKKWEKILGSLTSAESECLLNIFKKILQVEE